MALKHKKAARVHKREPDDLQWRVANSLLIFVIGLLFLGYGFAKAEEQSATGMAASGDVSNGATEFKELPVAYVLAGIVLIALAASSLYLYKKNRA